jgi:hypothetical protein
LPQPAAKDARASAISARAKSLRIVCTFTSSHAAAPVIFLERPCFPISKSGTQKKTPLAASGVGPNQSFKNPSMYAPTGRGSAWTRSTCLQKRPAG